MRWAKGTAGGQLQAQSFVLRHIDKLRACDPRVFGYDSNTDAECESKGSLPSCSGLDIYNTARRELEDGCPWLVPVKTGQGLLYAVGFEPDFLELDQIRQNAGFK
jgi:hypothetical protein